MFLNERGRDPGHVFMTLYLEHVTILNKYLTVVIHLRSLVGTNGSPQNCLDMKYLRLLRDTQLDAKIVRIWESIERILGLLWAP
jgi:hypothetical protein